MKKLLILFLILISAAEIYAHNPAVIFMGQYLFNVRTTPLQLTVWPLLLCNQDRVKIYGLHLAVSPLAYQETLYGVSTGVIMGSDDHYGLSASLIGMGNNNSGISIALYNSWESFSAVSLGLVNRSHRYHRDSRNLIQIGLYNEAANGLQIGLLNHNPNALIPWMPFFNYSGRTAEKEADPPQS